MKRIVALAERNAQPALRLLAAVNLLFFLSFVLLLMLAAGQARAQTPVCSGEDLLATLQAEDPETFERISAEAQATENGSGLLWKIEKEGLEPSFLFGTMHVTDPRVTTLPPVARTAFDGATTVAIETTEVLDPSKMMAVFVERPDLMMFTDGTTLASLLTPADRETVDAALKARGIPPASVARMKPWIIASMIALPACELARKAAGAPVLDVKLGEDAQAAGKTLEGLETAADQLDAMASLPMNFHVKGLVETLQLGDRMDDVIETMIVLYQRGETGLFWPLFRAVLPSGLDDDDGYAAFEATMVSARNENMVERAEAILRRGNAFIAVGALHLPGPQGLVALLQRDGYRVTRAD